MWADMTTNSQYARNTRQIKQNLLTYMLPALCYYNIRYDEKYQVKTKNYAWNAKKISCFLPLLKAVSARQKSPPDSWKALPENFKKWKTNIVFNVNNAGNIINKQKNSCKKARSVLYYDIIAEIWKCFCLHFKVKNDFYACEFCCFWTFEMRKNRKKRETKTAPLNV